MPTHQPKKTPLAEPAAGGYQSLSSGQIANLLAKRREDPAKWTPEKISSAFKANPEALKTFLEFYTNPLIVHDHKGQLLGYWELPEHMRAAKAQKAEQNSKESSPPAPSSSIMALPKLREQMRLNDLQSYIVPSEDPHNSEYIADCHKRRAFISGFTGSSGFAVITAKEALLWTDGRYYAQAIAEMSHDWTLMKLGLPTTPSREDWLVQNLPPKAKVGIDPQVITVSAAKTLAKALEAKDHSLVYLPQNLVDAVWPAVPSIPVGKVSLLPLSFAGRSTQEKLADLRAELQKSECSAIVLTALDEIAWLFNLRGDDISFNPVFFAYAYVTLDSAILYVDSRKLSDGVASLLGEAGVVVKEYPQIFKDLAEIPRSAENQNEKKILVPNTCNMALVNLLEGVATLLAPSPVTVAKAIKNPVELDGIRAAHIRDAVALCKFYCWLEGEITSGSRPISEVDAADKLLGFRKEQKHFVGLSFDTISASGRNGAIIHYRPHKDTARQITKDEVFLCDSGAQYLDGTTDVTRVFHFGQPTSHEKKCCTRVLQGHIALDRAIFPTTVTGYQLDPIARLPLWSAGLDYRHGTGHGVGAYLNVHEGPHGIGTRISLNDFTLKAHMTMTNEPGYYEDGNFGIRIENVMVIKPQQLEHNFGGVDFLGFEHVTLVPIQQNLLDRSLLAESEKNWLNSYHAECWQKLSPLLQDDPTTLAWLKKQTENI